MQAIERFEPDFVGAQIDSCLSDIGADAVKIGMLGTPGIAALVADKLERFRGPIVFDPVMVATSGSVLADAETIEAFERLMAEGSEIEGTGLGLNIVRRYADLLGGSISFISEEGEGSVFSVRIPMK